MDQREFKWMITIMVSVTVVKFILTIYCRRFTNKIVKAYAQDHCFDVITNSVGLAAAVLAVKFHWWIDPMGAIIVSSLLPLDKWILQLLTLFSFAYFTIVLHVFLDLHIILLVS